MSKTVSRVLIGVVAVIAVAIAGVAVAYPKAVRAVWCNLTVGSVPLDESSDWAGGESYLKVPYASDSPSQFVDIYVPETADDAKPKLFVIIHGGGFVLGDSQTRQAQYMYRYFRDHGYACASVNYRLAQEEPFPGALLDCKAAIRFLRAHADEYGFDASHIAVFGESAGGYLATMCSVTNDGEFNDLPFIGQDELGDVSAHVDVLVDYYGHIDNDTMAEDWAELGIPKPVRDIANSWASPDLLMGYEDFESAWFRKNVSEMTEDEKAYYDPHHYIAENSLDGLDVWIIHGDADITVPYLHSTRLYDELVAKLGEDRVELVIVPGMGHASDKLFSDDVLAQIEAFLADHLG